MIVGLISLASLKQESYPDVTPPQIQVTANYMGASAEVIESSVATILENKLNGVENLTYMSSTSYDGSYTLTMYFKVGSDKNIKLTTKDDLEMFKGYLKKEKDNWLK